MKIYKVGDYYHYESDTITENIHPSRIDIRDFYTNGETRILFSLDIVGRSKALDVQESFLPSEVVDRHGNSYGTTSVNVLDGLNSGTDVNVSDQTTPAIIAPFNRILNSTFITVPLAIDDYQVTVNDPTSASIVPGLNYLVLFDPASERFTQFNITGIAGSVLTLDRLCDFDYPIGTYCDIGRTNMGGEVGSLANPIIYGLRGTGAPPGVDITLDTTRILLAARTSTAVDLAKFCDITQLENGLLFRRVDGERRNIMSIKSNGGIKAIAYDWTPYSAQNLQHGQHGMGSRLTFAGQNKLGVAIRLPIGDDFQVIILDDLGDILELSIVAEGHITNPY